MDKDKIFEAGRKTGRFVRKHRMAFAIVATTYVVFQLTKADGQIERRWRTNYLADRGLTEDFSAWLTQE